MDVHKVKQQSKVDVRGKRTASDKEHAAPPGIATEHNSRQGTSSTGERNVAASGLTSSIWAHPNAEASGDGKTRHPSEATDKMRHTNLFGVSLRQSNKATMDRQSEYMKNKDGYAM
jgi:hypothetical protein